MIAFTLPPYTAVIVAAVLILLLFWLRKPGKGGAVGRAVRSSDHIAWQDAVRERRRKIEKLQRELDELLTLEPKL